MWVWLKIKPEGLRRFWSMFPLTRVPFWNFGFLSHSHVGGWLFRGDWLVVARALAKFMSEIGS